jgi:transposase-like protein
MDNQLTILKRDERGRVRSTAEAREATVAEYQRSGLSACAFAKMAGIAPTTFWNWLHALGLTQKRSSTALSTSCPTPSTAHESVRFLQVTPPAASAPTSALCVRLPGGAVIEVADELHAVLAAKLIQSLA